MEVTRLKHRAGKAVFVTSDLHLDHTNIISYCNRPFDNVREMNDVLINNWNRIIKPDDTVFFVGDMSFKSSDKYIPILNGNIYFIWGNHDQTTDPGSMHSSVPLTYKGINYIFVHDPKLTPRGFDGWVIHGHHHNNYPDQFPFFNPEKRRVNVSVELTKYQPVSLDYITTLIKTRHGRIGSL